jgi:hypothetical protein
VAPRALIVLLLVGLAVGCGGASGGDRKAANACLSRLGLFVDHGVPAHLFIPDRVPGLSYSATGLQQVAEVSYAATSPGANSLTAYYFDSERAARGVEADLVGPGTNFWGRTHPATRIGDVVLVWSSEPTARQESSVLACLEGG